MYVGKKGEVLLLLALALVIAGLGYIAFLGDDFTITGAGIYGTNGSAHCGKFVNDSTVLVGNISGCGENGLTINSSNLELDCDGYAIIGTFFGSDTGITFANSQTNTNITIRNCYVRNFSTGISVASNNIRANWSIINTTFENNTDGIFFSGPSGGNIINNSRIRSSTRHGIFFSSTGGNISVILTNSNISGSTITDIFASEGASGDWNLTIFNNFIEGKFNITAGVRRASIYNNRFDGTVTLRSDADAAENITWNTTYTTGLNIMGGPRIGGNFYSNYTGSDNGDDGIGDTANYSIPGSAGNTDFLPMVRTYTFTHPSLGTIADALVANSTFNSTNGMTNLSNHSTAQNITFYNDTSGRRYLRILAYFNASVDLSRFIISANGTAVVTNVSNVSTATAIDRTNHTLYLPNPGYRDGVFVCPSATNLAQVQWNCTNIQIFSKRNISDGIRQGGIVVREEGNEYEMENVSGSGASLGNITCGSVNESITLNQHITTNATCFYVNASNIIINGAGFNITSNGSGDGINADRGYDNLTVRNFGGIMRFIRGIEATDTNISLIFNNTVNSSNSLNGHAIRLDTSPSTNISNNILSVSGTNAMGTFLFASNNSYVASNTFTSSRNTSTGGITFSSSDSGTVENNIFITEGVGIRLSVGGGGAGSGSNLFLNNNITAVSDLELEDLTNDSIFNYLIYNASFGQIEWIDNGTASFIRNLTLNVSNSLGIGVGLNLFIANNTIALNTSGLSRSINTSANITMYGLNLTRITQIRKVENYTTDSAQIIDAGSDCIAAGSCSNLSYSGSTLVFNTTSFSSFAATEQTICETITVNTTLVNSITATGNCFIIGASNIVLDGGGYSITSSTGSGIGINSTGFENVTIRDFTGINNFSTAILISTSRNNSIFNNTIQSSNGSNNITINVQTSNFTNVTQNNVTTNASGGTAISFTSSSRGWIMNNTLITANGSSEAVNLSSSIGNNLSSNTITTFAAGSPGISMTTTSLNNYLSQNTIVTRVAEGVLIDFFSNGNIIYSNTINSTDEGISLSSVTNITAERNTIRTFGSNGAGILLTSGSGNVNFIRNNTIYTNGTNSAGISLSETVGSNLTLNSINTSHNDSGGIILATSSNSTNVIQNTIYTNRTDALGIDVVTSSLNNLSLNIVITRGNLSFGVHLASTSLSNFFENNNFTTYGNFSEGIAVDGGSADNTFLNNNLTADVSNEINDSTAIGTGSATPNYLIYNNSFGQIRWTNDSMVELLNVNVTNSFGMGLDRNIFIANNTIAVNTSAFGSGINSSANITLYGLNVSDVDEIRRVENYTTTSADILSAGTDCLAAGSCVNFSFSGSTLRFNTTSFSSFSVIDMLDCGSITSNITLDRSITTTGDCFTISASNIVLDGAGYSITSSTGSGTSPTGSRVGINSTGFENVTIRDFTGINNFSTAILISTSRNNSIFNNTIQSSNGSNNITINVQTSNFTNVTQNNVTTNASGGIGVNFTSSSLGWIMNNTIITANDSSDAVTLLSSTGNNLSLNTITTFGGGSQGISVTTTSSANYFLQNTIVTRVAGGITIDSSNSSFIYSNLINSTDEGIDIISSTNNTLERNTIRTMGSTATGMVLSSGSGNVNFIRNNTVYTNGTDSTGISLSETVGSNITLNTINTSQTGGEGMSISQASDNNNFISNTIYTNGSDSPGMEITGSLSSNISSNIMVTWGNGSSALRLATSSSRHLVENNNFTTHGNFSSGIALNFSSANNTLVNNNFTADLSNEINDSTAATTPNYLVYNNSFGQIRWTNDSMVELLNVNVTNSFGMGLDRNIFIANNTVAVNTSAFNSRVNSSANLTLYATGLSDVGVVRRLDSYETNATTILNTGRNCFAASCELIRFSGGILLFNTTSFSSFAAAANSPPNITTPAITPDPAFQNNSLSANTTYTDLNANAGTVVFRWYVNGTSVYNQTNNSVANGSVVISTLNTGNFSKTETINVTIYANDTDNSSFVGDLMNISNAPPFARAVNLTSSDLLNRTNGTLFGNWTFVDIDSDGAIRNETRWYNNTVEVTSLENSTTVGAGNTTRDQNWTFSIRVFDGTNWSNFVNSSTMNITNALPSVRAVNITSSDTLNRTNGTLFGNWTFEDIDLDGPIRNETRWYNNTVEVTSLENSTTIGAGNTTRDQNWTFSIRAFDGTNWGDFVNSSAMNISNAAPEQIATIPDISVIIGNIVTRNLSTYFRDIDNDELNYTIRNITFANSSINNTIKILTVTGLSVADEITNITANDNTASNVSSTFSIFVTAGAASSNGDGGGSSPKYICKYDSDCPPTTERYCSGSKVQERTISSICQNPKTVRAQCVLGKEQKSRTVEDCVNGCSAGSCILREVPPAAEGVGSGISCPPGTELVNENCVNITIPAPVKGNFQEIEQLFPEDNVFPTIFPKIFSVQNPTITGLNCVVPSGEAITSISESTLNKAKEAFATKQTQFLYDVAGSRFKLILALFEEPGELCLGVDIRCPTPEKDNFWQFQSVFSRGFSSFTDEFCIPLDGNPMLIGQDFKMCSTLQQEIDQCHVSFTPKFRKK